MVSITQDRFDRFLHDITVCFLTRNFALWESRIALPFSMVTAKGPALLDTQEALRRNFDLYLVAGDIMKLDQVLRDPLALEDCGDGTWLGTYETRLVSRGGLATDPYVSTAMLVDADGRVKMTSILNARGFHDWVQ